MKPIMVWTDQPEKWLNLCFLCGGEIGELGTYRKILGKFYCSRCLKESWGKVGK